MWSTDKIGRINLEPPKVTNFNYENSQTLKTESRRSTISVFVSYTNIKLQFNCDILLIASGPLFKACGLVLKKNSALYLRRIFLSKIQTRRLLILRKPSRLRRREFLSIQYNKVPGGNGGTEFKRDETK